MSRPGVGIAAIISDRGGRVVLGRRKCRDSVGFGQWGFPGGRLEYGEEIFDCAERETLEETGLQVRALKSVAVTNTVFATEKLHYITIYVVCERLREDQQPELLEPDKCDGWHWKSWQEMEKMMEPGEEENLFTPIVHLFREHRDPETLSKVSL